MDNWQDYFEEKDILSYRYNAFDELEDALSYKILTLKDGITIDHDKSDIAVEFNGHCERWYVDINTDTLDFTFEERIDDFEISDSEIEEFDVKTYNTADGEQKLYVLQYATLGENFVRFEEETQRYRGVRFFFDEIIRIKGTLYITQ